MRRTPLSFLRAASLAWALAVGGVVVMAPPVVESVEARRRVKKKRRSGGHGKPNRKIRREGELTPRREVELDEEVTKTKDFKPTLEDTKGPTLSAAELERATTEQMLDAKLNEEIDLAKQLLDLTSDCEEGSPVRFRLADMYWEKSKRAFFKANDFNTSEKDRSRYQKLAKRLQSLTVKNYEKIANDCPGYSETPKVLLYLGKALIELDRPKEGATYFTRIIKEFPDNEWVGHAWFWVGNYYFDHANDAHKALKAYKNAGEYRDSQWYAFAVYKQGWCYINTGDWDLALDRFRTTVRICEDRGYKGLDPKAKKSIRREALRDYVRSFSNIGNARDAVANFLKVGGKGDLRWMLERLGKWYIQRDEHKNVVFVQKDLIQNYARSTRLPIYQGHIVRATSRLGDKRNTVKQAKMLTKYFGDVRARADSGKMSEEDQESVGRDLREAEELAENTLRSLAMEYHKEAKKLRGSTQMKTYTYAHDLYKHYLMVFPEPQEGVEVNYVFYMRYYYAEVLYKLEKFLESARNYEMVVDMNPHPKRKKEKEVVLIAAEEAVRSYDELVEDLDRKNPPEVSGSAPKPIPDLKLALIRACQRYIQYVGSVGDRIVEIRYKMARIYYTYNHFDKAAPAFDDIVANHPGSEVACYAANLTLDIYNGAKDYKALKNTSRAYLDNSKLACGEEDRQKFAVIEEKSAFQMVKTEYEDKKKFLKAANAYLAFYREFPKSESSDEAVFNAAVNYDRGNRLEKANEVRKFLVEKFPSSPLVPDTLYNIAESYERIVDFGNAAKYLELYVKRYPEDQRSKDALYNAGLYRAMLLDFKEAKTNRESFVKRYGSDDEVHRVAFSICETLEKAAERSEGPGKGGKQGNEVYRKWVEAHDCYYNFVRNSAWSRKDPDLLCHAQFRRGEIMRTKTNYGKGAAEQKKYLLSNWDGWQRRHGLKKLSRCAAAVAQIKFRDLRDDFQRYSGMLISEFNPTPKKIKLFKKSVEVKIKTRDKLIKQYQEIAKLGVAEWGLAALFQIGEAYRDSIEKLLAAPLPTKVQGTKLGPEEKAILRDQLRKEAAPIEGLAVEAYRFCVVQANELGVYNRWSVRALDELQKLRPQEYPLFVEQLGSVRFEEKLKVVRNGLMILEGERYVPARIKLVAGAPPPGEKPKKKKKPAAPAGEPPADKVQADDRPAQKGRGKRSRRGRRRRRR